MKRDRNRQAIQDQYLLRVINLPDGEAALNVVAMAPNVDQLFGRLFRKASAPPRQTQSPCKRQPPPWQGGCGTSRTGS